MGIKFLMGLLFGIVAFFAVYVVYDKKHKNSNRGLKWLIASLLFFVGMLLGIGFSANVGEKIAKKYLESQATITVLDSIGLLPFSGTFGAYIITGENNIGEKVAWYLQENGNLFEEPYDDIIDRNMIVFTNAIAPAKQLVKVNVGSFWKWFVIIPNIQRLVIPAGGLHKGMIIKTYKFIPVYPE